MMRTIHLDAVNRIAQHLLLTPRHEWRETALRWLSEAHTADKYRKSTGKLHEHGDGDIMGHPELHPVGHDYGVSDDMIEALEMALTCVRAWRIRTATPVPALAIAAE